MKTALHRIALAVLCAAMLVPSSGCGGEKSILDPSDPAHITIWHYYNGTQLIAFDNMVTAFNETVGKEQGVFVEASSEGSVNELAGKVLDTANGVAGAGELPNIFGAYPDTAYDVLMMDKVVDLADFMTPEEIAAYHPSFWEEGIIDGKAVIFPIAKSTEVLFMDENAWNEFAEATGETRPIGACLATWEGVAEAAEAYYEYTDGLTPDVAHDGKALLGIDSMANFLLVLLRQQGVDFMVNDGGHGKITYDEAALRRIWDIYYRPMADGRFAAVSRYRSDDMKTGVLMGFVGSNTGTSYFPSVVTFDDGAQKEASLTALPVPVMEGGEPWAVQQGAGMVITKSDERHEYASILFLKWLTEAERNLAFAVESAYLPVRSDALRGEAMNTMLGDMAESGDTLKVNTERVFRVALGEIDEYGMYYSPTFPGRFDIRGVLDELQPMAAQARADILERAAGGGDYDALIEAAAGDAAFEAWLASAREKIDAILAQFE